MRENNHLQKLRQATIMFNSLALTLNWLIVQLKNLSLRIKYRKTIHIVRESASTHRMLHHPNHGFHPSIQIQREKNVDRLWVLPWFGRYPWWDWESSDYFLLRIEVLCWVQEVMKPKLLLLRSLLKLMDGIYRGRLFAATIAIALGESMRSPISMLE